MAFGDLLGTLTGNAASITNPAVLTGSVAVSIGDLVYAVIGEQTAPTSTACADNLTNSYAQTQAATDAGTSTGHAFWSKVTAPGTLTTINITATASNQNFAAIAAVIAGPFDVSPLDANPTNITTDITTPFTCPPTGTLTQANQVIMSWGVVPGNATWTATAPNVLALQAATAAILKVAVGYQVVASTATVSPQFAGTSVADAVLGTTSFKAAPSDDPPFNSATDAMWGPLLLSWDEA